MKARPYNKMLSKKAYNYCSVNARRDANRGIRQYSKNKTTN